ncbi:MAG: hypothetical protein RJB66_1396 [Pseudomonadota bacterium]|jgi:hypothetical protein
MLVKCPKCGFDQPEDTYCAKCGIEMGSFKPTKPPIWSTIVKSPIFSIIIFVGLGYLAFLYLNKPTRFPESTSKPTTTRRSSEQPSGQTGAFTSLPSDTSLANASETMPSTPPQDGSEAAAPSTTLSESSASLGEPLSAPPSPTTMNTSNTIQPNSESTFKSEEGQTDSNGDVQARSTNTESAKGPLEIDVKFVEAPNSLVQQFLAEASENTGGDSGELSYAVVKNGPRWMRHRGFVELDHLTKKIPGLKKQIQWFSGAQSPELGSNLGLNFRVMVQERIGAHIIGEIIISRTLVEIQNSVPITTRKDFTTRFETDVGSLIGLAGVFPHTPIPSDEKDWLQGSLLKVYLSPQFIENESELLILLHFKSDSP